MPMYPDGLSDSWDLKQLETELGHQAIKYILRLWSHCKEIKTDRLGKIPTSQVAYICRSEGDPNRFVLAMIACGFLAEKGGVFTVPHFRELNSSWIQKINASKAAVKARRAKQLSGSGSDGPHAEDRSTDDPTDDAPSVNRRSTDGATNIVQDSIVQDKKVEETGPGKPTLRRSGAIEPEEAIAFYRDNPAYRNLDVEAQVWAAWNWMGAKTRGRVFSRQYVVNWLNREMKASAVYAGADQKKNDESDGDRPLLNLKELPSDPRYARPDDPYTV